MKKDPENLEPSYKPAIIEFVDETQKFVCHQTITDHGWLYCLAWDGTRERIPPARIASVRFVETDRVSDDQTSWKELKDDVLVKRAKREAGLVEEREAREVEA